MPRRLLFVLFTCLLGNGYSQVSSISSRELPPLPDSIGYNGSFIGNSKGDIIVAGGANFPDDPVWEGGQKVWYDNLYVLSNDDTTWITDPTWRIPKKLGYGVTIETEEGLLCFGGSNSEEVSDLIFLIQWNPEQKEIKVREVGQMPKGMTSMGGALVDNKVYLAGGFDKPGGAATSNFFEYDLISKVWKEPETWPGLPRINPVVVSQNNGRVNSLYLFSGRDFQPNSPIPHTLHSDVFSFNPKAGVWVQLEDIPSNNTPGIEGGFLGAAPAIPMGGSHILLFGGAGGPKQELLKRMEVANQITRSEGNRADSLREEDKKLVVATRFSKTIWAYHTITDTWVELGDFPGESQVVTTAVRFGANVAVIGGEVGPGVRTTRGVLFEIIEPDQKFGFWNYVSLTVYLAVIVGLGWYFSRRTKTTNDYFLGGQRVPWWAAGLSIYATQLSAITYLAIPALAFSFDWQAYLGMSGILLMAPIVIRYYLPHYRKLNIITAYQYLEERFNVAVRLVGSASFVLFQLVRMGIVVYLPALAISAMIGLDIYTAILLMGTLAILYTVLGGIEAVIWTDVLQVVVLMGGVVVSLLFVYKEVGDLDSLFTTAIDNNKFRLFDWRLSTTEVVTWSLFLGSFALNIAPYTTDQTVVQRYLTTKDQKATTRSIWLNGLLTMPAAALIFLLGTFLFVFYKIQPEGLLVGMENDKIFPLFIANNLPIGIAGLVVAGIFSASMSSLDSSMHSVATVLTVDYFKRFRHELSEKASLSTAKWVTIISGIFGTLVACILAMSTQQSVFFLFQEVVGLFGSTLAGIFILGVFTKNVQAKATLLGAALSLLVLIYLKYFTGVNFYIYPLFGIPICIISGILAQGVLKRSPA